MSVYRKGMQIIFNYKIMGKILDYITYLIIIIFPVINFILGFIFLDTGSNIKMRLFGLFMMIVFILEIVLLIKLTY